MLEVVFLVFFSSFHVPSVISGPGDCTKRVADVHLVAGSYPSYTYKTVHYCCNGYMKIDGKCTAKCIPSCVFGQCVEPNKCKCQSEWEGRACDLPICSPSCQHGKCVAPNICVCDPGWKRKECDLSCGSDEWGEYCAFRCNCKNGASCNPETGNCLCAPGWMGIDCGEVCHEGYYGFNCSLKCKCENDVVCDHITGECDCKPGYQGSHCSEKCQEGSYGYNCTEKCQCQNNGTCDHKDGSCTCTPGWTGLGCGDVCPEGFFGHNCSEICKCFNNATCDSVTGECICKKGYDGNQCQIQCRNGTWGKDCAQTCGCKHGECDITDEKCNCFSGYQGVYCDKDVTVIVPEGVDRSSLFSSVAIIIIFVLIILLIINAAIIMYLNASMKELRKKLSRELNATDQDNDKVGKNNLAYYSEHVKQERVENIYEKPNNIAKEKFVNMKKSQLEEGIVSAGKKPPNNLAQELKNYKNYHEEVNPQFVST